MPFSQVHSNNEFEGRQMWNRHIFTDSTVVRGHLGVIPWITISYLGLLKYKDFKNTRNFFRNWLPHL